MGTSLQASQSFSPPLAQTRLSGTLAHGETGGTQIRTTMHQHGRSTERSESFLCSARVTCAEV